METKKHRLTKEQKMAVQNYEYCLRQEDRYFGSVFYEPMHGKALEAKTSKAYENAKRLGVANFC